MSLFFVVLASLPQPSGSDAPERWRAKSEQVLVVAAESWSTSEAKLYRFDREGESYRSLGDPIPVTTGKNGLGTGVDGGLEVIPDLSGSPMKMEGDGRAPAGIFWLKASFGNVPPLPRGGGLFPFYFVEDEDRWVDDQKSQYYNKWVRLDDARITKDWSSAEILSRQDGLYGLVVVIDYNILPVKGRGSAIFMHRWRSEGSPTVGCTAMDPAALKEIWKWLVFDKSPVLIQAPKEALRHLELPPSIHEGIFEEE